MSAKKLWDKGYSLHPDVEAFSTGDDWLLDRRLVRWDCVGSMAHARMLESIGILSAAERKRLHAELGKVIRLWEKGEFTVEPQDEDVHTAVEAHLTKKLGDLGKKIHTARSRNDQVLVDLRLYTKDSLLSVAEEAEATARALVSFAERGEEIPMCGRTHTQRAMLSSLGLWAGSFAESLVDDLRFLRAAYELNDQCPLGSAASYGVHLPIDRELTSRLLGFSRVQNNVLYANNSRGKIEAAVLSALVQIMLTLAKIASDIVMYCAPEFGYFVLPDALALGSSIMPQKRNPCALELVRARAATVLACLFQVAEIVRPLPSGYNRDFQETKRPLMQGLDVTLGALRVVRVAVEEISVDEDALRKGCTPEIYATDRALELAVEGVPFRDAYRRVAAELDELSERDPVEEIRRKTHVGAPGNLRLDAAVAALTDEGAWWGAAGKRFREAIDALLAG